ncbi:non-specific lipid-transfer protein-like [Centruroides sculpturatus]|uniref:non-specific lipid-transfer protein-like n=1 Tax=Centruroides sculpturatus TaxID=218467 RepID=UPI000C6E5E1D|nr:non-specific lipid-transfer protein-like [Centruroides sculpturatus]
MFLKGLKLANALIRQKWQRNFATSYQLCNAKEFAKERKGGKVYIVGASMTPFIKPEETSDYPEMVKDAMVGTLSDANLKYDQIQQAFVGYVFGQSTSGQRALYDIGMTGIPICNVNNNCSTGATALFLAYSTIAGGLNDCVLAIGFEKMHRESLRSPLFTDRAMPVGKHCLVLSEKYGISEVPMAAQMFGAAGREHMEKFGTKKEHFAMIAWKNHKHSVKNKNAQMQQEYSLEEILNSPVIYEPLTRLQCCPVSDGAAGTILASEEFVREHRLEKQAVEILGMEMGTDFPSTFEENSCIKMVGFDMTKKAAEKLYRKTGISPKDVDVVELHDCFSTNELITYEALGLCDVGKGSTMVESGDNTYGGKYVVNPSGGLIAKGHPLGATGLAQCTELCLHLRNKAGDRQVPNAKLALQHNIGLGGATVVALYKLGEFS